MRSWRSLGLIAVLGAALHSPAEEAKPQAAALSTAQTPDWVKPVEWSVPTTTPPPGVAAEVILSDSQDRLTTHASEFYFHEVVRLLTSTAVTQYAQQTRSISPDFEHVTWHTLKLYRDGKVIDRLPETEFKKLQRELGLEGQTLTGETTYAGIVDDVRVGDVMELAYTLKYANPMFEGRLTSRHYLADTDPIDREIVSIELPADGPPVRISVLEPDGTAGLPDVLYRSADVEGAIADQTHGNRRTITWEGRDLPAITFDPRIPGRAYPYWPQIRVSSFTTWDDVVTWAEPLFAAPDKLPDSLQRLIGEWKAEKDPARRLAAAVHWVQTDVRYFALDLGDHNLRPRPLADVCSTRFGDCKDKSLLLSTILRALGFEAWPALINTYWRDRLHEVRPDPHAFNHAVVAYQFDGKLRWIDPTITNQQGKPGEWAFPPYRTALIIRHGEADLTDIPPAADSEPDTFTKDIISVDGATGEALVNSEVTVRGLQADFLREASNAMSPAERSKNWFNFIARFYRQLEEIEPPTLQDDRAADVIVIRAKYRLPGFVKKESGGPVIGCYAYALRALLDPPESRRRLWPYALPNDRFLRHRIEIELPFDMPVEQLPEVIQTDGIDFRVERGVSGHRAVVQYDLRFSQDSVPANRMAQFCDNVDEILTEMGVTLHPPPGADEKKAHASGTQ